MIQKIWVKIMQIIVISGKGGTGKTTIASAFAYLSGQAYINVDCDVDASNLHLMFKGTDIEETPFIGAKLARIDTEKCHGCGACEKTCRFGAIVIQDGVAYVKETHCEGCGACRYTCTQSAISLGDEVTGSTIITDSTVGLISRAEMIPGAEGSGKLVTKVRKNAREYRTHTMPHSILDGSPGVGCAVMASVTGCDYAVIVAEPTLSGFEDLKRVYELIRHFGIKPLMVINKYDINREVADDLERFCKDMKVPVVGRVPFDEVVERSINEGVPVVAYEISLAGKAIRRIWNDVESLVHSNGGQL